ncbi:hypothetical protein NGUA32_01019 [Salmonella enterica]|nr:hypothetical protein NGUA32_01019 [Salmonella enterica]
MSGEICRNELAAGVQLQAGVIVDIAAAQRLNVAGDQRTVADKGAAGISIAAGKRERAVAGFYYAAATADGVGKVAAGVQLQRGVVGDVAGAQRVTSLATSVPPLIRVPPV